jgi:hypothetical protein
VARVTSSVETDRTLPLAASSELNISEIATDREFASGFPKFLKPNTATGSCSLIGASGDEDGMPDSNPCRKKMNSAYPSSPEFDNLP